MTACCRKKGVVKFRSLLWHFYLRPQTYAAKKANKREELLSTPIYPNRIRTEFTTLIQIKQNQNEYTICSMPSTTWQW